jgi:uncharacterized membrane protein YqjE
MENPSSQKNNKSQLTIKNTLLLIKLGSIFFISYIILITIDGERISFKLSDIWAPILLYIIMLFACIYQLSRESNHNG